MNKLLTIFAVFGLFSSVAFATETNTMKTDLSFFDFRCDFDGWRDDKDHHHATPIVKGAPAPGKTGYAKGDHHKRERLECWVEGSICTDEREKGAFDILKKKPICEERDNSLRIHCSNGFRLSEEDPAVEIKKGDLFINAESRDKIATLLIMDFIKSEKSKDRSFKLDADLLISEWRNDAQRLEGDCRFEKREKK